jgi:hypothetical protein
LNTSTGRVERDIYVQGKENVHLFAEFYGKPEIGRKGFDLGFGLIVARTLPRHVQAFLPLAYQSNHIPY